MGIRHGGVRHDNGGDCAMNAVGAPSSSILLHSRSGKRLSPRVTLPVALEILGERYWAQDWGSGGVGVVGQGPALALGDQVPIRLMFDLSGNNVTVEVTGTVARVDGGTAQGFSFAHAARNDLLVLDRIAGRWLDGQVEPGGRTLTPIEQARPALQAATWPRRLRTAAFLATGLAVLAAGITYVVASRLTVYSDYAAVAGDMRVIRAPAAGYLAQLSVTAGAAVQPGQVVGRLEPTRNPQATSEANGRVQLLDQRIQSQRAALASVREGHLNYTEFAETSLTMASQGRMTLQEQVAAETRIYDRLRSLSSSGWVSPLRSDQEEVVLRGLQRQLAVAQADEAAARQRLDDAKRGRFVTDGRSTQPAPADIQRSVNDLLAERAAAAQQVQDLTAPIVLTAPCACRVTAVAAAAQTFVAEGNPVATLAATGDASREVDVLVLSSQLGFVQVGQAANVFLSDRTDAVPGRVKSVNYNPANPGRVGLPDTLRTLSNYGLVTVTLDNPAGPGQAGLPATVGLPVPFGMIVRNLPGIAWLFGTPGQAS